MVYPSTRRRNSHIDEITAHLLIDPVGRVRLTSCLARVVVKIWRSPDKEEL